MSEKSQLIDKLSQNRKLREAYVRSKVSTNVASQIRALRRRQGLTQAGFAQLAEMKQSRISAMERPGTTLNVETLVRLAAALRMGLIVKFASYSEMLVWENGFSQDDFDVVTIDEDVGFHRDDDTQIEQATVAGATLQQHVEAGTGEEESEQEVVQYEENRPVWVM